MYSSFKSIDLDQLHELYVGQLPAELFMNAAQFETVWLLHPPDYHDIRVHHRWIKTPRWQQAYGKGYIFSRTANKALPIPDLLAPLLDWCRENIDSQLNGLLLNWYDGTLGHTISRHRDSRQNLKAGAPIVTISFGERRVFRLRPYRGKGYIDLDVDDGTVLTIPYDTNLAWTHEVPDYKRYRGRRISVTARAFGA
jgi:alkylated DNA repair dioxygenase AlkB